MRKLRVHETGGPSYRTPTGALVFHGDYVIGSEISAEDAAQIVTDGRGEYLDEPVKKAKAKDADHLA
jgi:hypothetical protein